jgi:hypothetical protein
MEAVLTSETSVNIYLSTRQYIPEDSKLHTRRRENLKADTVRRLFRETCNMVSFLHNHLYSEDTHDKRFRGRVG